MTKCCPGAVAAGGQPAQMHREQARSAAGQARTKASTSPEMASDHAGLVGPALPRRTAGEPRRSAGCPPGGRPSPWRYQGEPERSGMKRSPITVRPPLAGLDRPAQMRKSPTTARVDPQAVLHPERAIQARFRLAHRRDILLRLASGPATSRAGSPGSSVNEAEHHHGDHDDHRKRAEEASEEEFEHGRSGCEASSGKGDADDRVECEASAREGRRLRSATGRVDPVTIHVDHLNSASSSVSAAIGQHVDAARASWTEPETFWMSETDEHPGRVGFQITCFCAVAL